MQRHALMAASIILLAGWWGGSSKSEAATAIPTGDQIDIIADVGYFLSIDNTDPIHIVSNLQSSNPVHTYSGCSTYTIESNFNALLAAEIRATSPAGGDWSVSLSPDAITPGATAVTVCVSVTQLDVTHLTGGGQGVKVAELTLLVIPTLN